MTASDWTRVGGELVLALMAAVPLAAAFWIAWADHKDRLAIIDRIRARGPAYTIHADGRVEPGPGRRRSGDRPPPATADSAVARQPIGSIPDFLKYDTGGPWSNHGNATSPADFAAAINLSNEYAACLCGAERVPGYGWCIDCLIAREARRDEP